MELLWLYYKGLKHSRYILFLKLGTKGDKVCGLDTQKIDDSARRRIVHNLSGVSLERAISWLRTNHPMIYKSAYRELPMERATVNSRHPIDPSKVL